MVRSLWTGATGMNSQQTHVDTIANNLANVNTVGYKSQSVNFKSLLYQDLQSPSTTANGDPKPTDSEVGLGSRVGSIASNFKQGALLVNDSNTALAVQGKGMFAYHDENGNVCYTRSGDFNWSLGNDTGDELVLVTANGNPVLNNEGEEIRLRGDYIASKVVIEKGGMISYPDEEGNTQSLNIKIGLWQFNNFEGLVRTGDTSFSESEASGEAINEDTNENVTKSTIMTGYLEGSNTDVATEMVNLITAQRAYELNSRIITTTDEMMKIANQLK